MAQKSGSLGGFGKRLTDSRKISKNSKEAQTTEKTEERDSKSRSRSRSRVSNVNVFNKLAGESALNKGGSPNHQSKRTGRTSPRASRMSRSRRVSSRTKDSNIKDEIKDEIKEEIEIETLYRKEEETDNDNNITVNLSTKITDHENCCAHGFNPCFTCRGRIALRTWCKIMGVSLLVLSIMGLIVCSVLYVNKVNFLLHNNDSPGHNRIPGKLQMVEKLGVNLVFILGILTGIFLLVATQCLCPVLCLVTVVSSIFAITTLIVLMVYEIDYSKAEDIEIGIVIYVILILIFVYVSICSIGLYLQEVAGLYQHDADDQSLDQAI